jgi:hypothetical protein
LCGGPIVNKEHRATSSKAKKEQDMDSSEKFNIGRWLRSRAGLTLIAFLAIAAFFLVTEHTAHFFGILPYALLLLCPLLHLFMHGGHADHQAVEERQ